MSTYQIKNLKEIENSAERFGLAPNIEARFARTALESERSGLSYQRLAPGFRPPTGHRHQQQEETYVVVSGSGRVKIGDEIHDLRQWDALRVSAGVTRAFEAGDDGLAYIAIGGNPTGDADIIQNWWDD